MPAIANLASTLANRALQREATLRMRLAAHAGSVFSVAAGPAHAVFAIDGSGALAPAQHAAVPTLAMRVRLRDVPLLLHDPSRFAALVTADGDAALATTFGDIVVAFPWFVEQLFGDAFGAVIGQRIADAGRSLLGFPDHVATRLHGSVTSYVREEADILVGSDEASAFDAEVAAMTTRVDALAARVDPIARAAA